MTWQIRTAFAGLAALVISAGAGHAAPWTRGYVVGTYEFAFHYGGRAGFTRTGEIESKDLLARTETSPEVQVKHVHARFRE